MIQISRFIRQPTNQPINQPKMSIIMKLLMKTILLARFFKKKHTFNHAKDFFSNLLFLHLTKPSHPSCHQGFTDAVTQMYLSSGVQAQDVTTPTMGHLVWCKQTAGELDFFDMANNVSSWKIDWKTTLYTLIIVDCGLCMVILMLEAM